MGMEITIKLDEAASEHVRSLMENGARFYTVEDYVTDLIRRDADHAFHADEAVIAELRRAYATPESEYVMVSAEDVIRRNLPA